MATKSPTLIALRKIKPASSLKSALPNTKPSQCDNAHSVQLSKRSPSRKDKQTNVQPDKLTPKVNLPENMHPLNGVISCEFCDMKLPNISKAIYHKYQKHRSEGRNYMCVYCGSIFPIRVALENHTQRSHGMEMELPKTDEPANSRQEMAAVGSVVGSNELKHDCRFCPATFVSKNAVAFHEKHVHAMELEMLQPIFMPPPSLKIRVNHISEVYSVYYCYLCGSEYCVKYNLKKHINEHHKPADQTPPPEGLIRCTLCEAVFYTKRAYNAHTMHHKPQDLYVTSEEHRKEVVNRIDQDFDFRRIPSTEIKFQPKRRKLQRAKATFTTPNKKSNDDSLSPPSDSSEDETTSMVTKQERVSASNQ